ncbi:MAG: DUF3090 family protein [Actinobacteria bacterium]|uniref:Unannotated protein n=1 Tax=freshwater metagenome TaxID=449393 RepID=A0A6J6Q034_9ZZZZ|nr:DUF3090 family protein [Actinomycetota bacterium]
MSERIIFSHEDATRFIVGTVGLPGERSFFIQAVSDAGITTVAVEKSQVVALTERLAELITEIRRSKLASLDEIGLPAVTDNANLEFPIEEEFTAGVMGIAWDPDTQRVSIEIQSIADGDFTELISDDEDLADVEDPPDLLRVTVRLNQVRGFINRAETIILAGRAPCPFCGLPIDPNGHLCPRANGYRR